MSQFFTAKDVGHISLDINCLTVGNAKSVYDTGDYANVDREAMAGVYVLVVNKITFVRLTLLYDI